MTKKSKPKYNQNAAIRGALRRAFARSPIVQEVLHASRREVPRYNKDGSISKKPAVQRQCNVCCKWVGSTKVVVDHITPVIPIDNSFTSWDDFIVRLWCSKENLQLICLICHAVKTYDEKIARLTLQYTKELDDIELKISSIEPSELNKILKVYISKKKIPALLSIAERAQLIHKNVFTKKTPIKKIKK